MEAPTPAARLDADADELAEVTEKIPDSPRALVVTLWAILGVLLLYTLYFARSIALPVAVAALLSLVFAPLVRAGAALLLVCVVGAAVWGVVALAEPATVWVERAPAAAREIERKLRFLRDPVARMSEATDEVERAAQIVAVGPEQTEVVEVVVAEQSWSDHFLQQTSAAAVSVLATLILLYFLLSTPDSFLGKLVEALPTLRDKKRVVAAARRIESEVSRYLATITAINAMLGLAVGVSLYFLNVPNAALWGVLAAATNFIPYVGAWGLAAVLAAVGVLTFDDPLRMFMPAGVFVSLTTVETYLVTPIVLGRRLTLSPVAVFLSVLFWSWIWGMTGALIAVPLLAATKIVMQQIPALEPLARFLD
jgi:predicted PurR-regulated permease PerM